jgi:histidine triad (HIT) family protein
VPGAAAPRTGSTDGIADEEDEGRSRVVAGEAQPDCLFCKIAAGEIPATVVRETDTTLAFRDINPQAPTHVLVIPRVHYPNAAELAAGDPGAAADVLREAGEVAAREKVDGSGYRIVFNTGSGAGQTVFHAHAHVLGGRDLQRLV